MFVVNKILISDFGIAHAISKAVLEDIDIRKIFKDLDEHLMENAINDNHLASLISAIAKNYSKVRLHHLGREANLHMTGEKV